jgi:hypothetical protein
MGKKDDAKNNFGSLLFEYMNQVGLSDARLAWKISVDRQLVRRWRTGEVQNPRNCQKVLEAAQTLKLTLTQCEKLLHSAGCESILTDWFQSENRPIIPQPRKPIVFPHHFFGREAVLKRIKWAWDHNGLGNIALIGPRSSGKTSLLHYLEEMGSLRPYLRPDQPKGWEDWRPVNIQFAVVDFHDPGMCQPEVLFCEILQQLNLAPSLDENLEGFINKLKRVEKPTIIMMDEIHVGIREIGAEFWYGMRHLCGHNPYLGFLVTARKSVEQLALDYGKASPFFNLFGNIELEPFTEAEAQELLDHLPSEISQTDKRWILKTSQRWPALLQILCDECLFALKQGEQKKVWKNRGLRAIQSSLSYLSTPVDNFSKPASVNDCVFSTEAGDLSPA